MITAQQVRMARAALKWSVAELARRAGVTPKTVLRYENGGNTTHRLLDGHPNLFVYPFESQVGTKWVNDYLAGMYPNKYRWPLFPNPVSPEEAYEKCLEKRKFRTFLAHPPEDDETHPEEPEPDLP